MIAAMVRQWDFLKLIMAEKWSGRRGSNPRLPPWQGGALPLSYARKAVVIKDKDLV